MATFSTEKRLPSCFVDKPLIQSLEDYLKRRIAELPVNPRAPKEANWFSVEVTDPAGTEDLESITQLGPVRFYDGTAELAVSYRGYHPDLLEIKIRFARARDQCLVRVQYRGDEAREFVTGLVDYIERLLSQSTTAHSWFHMPSAVEGALFMSTFLILFVAIPASWSAQAWLWRSTILLGGGLVGYHLLAMCKPYTMFDTRRNDFFRRVSNWLIAGLAGFVLFATLGDYFRRWLGF